MDSVMHSDKVSSTASEGRKSSKPIMEKRRRARINASLAELKSLLLEVMKKEGARQNKMEKADILEMTVKHLRQLQRQQFSALASSDPAIINKYRLGFNECASEVSKFLGSQDSMDAEVRARLLNHLANVVVSTEGTSPQNVAPQPQVHTNSTVSSTSGNNNILQLTSTPISVQSSTPIQSVPTIICPPNTNGSCQTQIENKYNNIMNTNGGINLQVQTQYQTSEINNNTMTINTPVQSFVGGQQMQFTKVFNGLQVLPTKMSSGDMALIIPANLIQGGTIPNYVIPVLSSSNVTPCQTTVSPVNISQSTMSTVPPKEIMAPSSVMTFPINISANTSGINTDIIQMKPVFEHKSIDSNQTSPTLNHQHRPGSVNSYQNDSLQKLDNMWRPW